MDEAVKYGYLRSVAVAAALAVALPWAAACGEPDAAEGPEADRVAFEHEREGIEIPPPPEDREVDGADQERPAEARAAAESVDNADRVRIMVGGIPVRVEIADDPETREQGLMFRESLADDEGMLFVYPSERILSFWMRNTPLALDIAFLDRTGRIVDIQQLEPFDEETTSSRQPAMYALEVRRGWFEDHGVEVGDRVEF